MESLLEGFGSKEEESEPEPKWQKATWDGIPGYARLHPDEDADEDGFDFSVEIPEEAELVTVALGYTSDYAADHVGTYTLSYQIKNAFFWKLITLNEVSEEDNWLANFSAHRSEDFERVVGFENINHDPSLEL